MERGQRPSVEITSRDAPCSIYKHGSDVVASISDGIKIAVSVI